MVWFPRYFPDTQYAEFPEKYSAYFSHNIKIAFFSHMALPMSMIIKCSLSISMSMIKTFDSAGMNHINIFCFVTDGRIIRVGRAKRGASGALYLQSATAGRMSAPGIGWSGRIGQAALKAGSCATGFYESGQTLTGAALS